MVNGFWILAALFGGFLLGIIFLGVLSFDWEEDAYQGGFEDGIKNSAVGPGGKQMEPATCVFFRPSCISPNICAKWIIPLKSGKPPFCLADEECQTQGLRWAPQADSDNDGVIHHRSGGNHCTTILASNCKVRPRGAG